MDNNYFEQLLNDYENNGVMKHFFIYRSAFKLTNICIWEYDNYISVSNAYDYIYKYDSVLKDNEHYGLDRNIPILIFDSNDFKIIESVIAAIKKNDYKEKLELLKEITNEKKLVLNKVDNN